MSRTMTPHEAGTSTALHASRNFGVRHGLRRCTLVAAALAGAACPVQAALLLFPCCWHCPWCTSSRRRPDSRPVGCCMARQPAPRSGVRPASAGAVPTIGTARWIGWTGTACAAPHLPQRLVCRNSAGAEASIVEIVRTQGSDTKLVGQMQPWYEARSLGRPPLAGRLADRPLPPLVTQIADGENGGVMMNEFPPKYRQVVHEAAGSDVPLTTATEYLEHLRAAGVSEQDLPAIQPLFQQRIWARMQPGDGAARLAEVIDALAHEDGRFHMEGGSWTNNLSRVRRCGNLPGPLGVAGGLIDARAPRRTTAWARPARHAW